MNERIVLLLAGGVWIAVIWLLRRRCRDRQPAERYDLDVLAGGSLFVLTIGFFWRTVSCDVFQPADGGDLVSFLFPTYRFAASQLAQGDFPLWNPTLYGGAPFISDIQAGHLYPPNLLLLRLWPEFPYTVMQWLSIGHIYWAGLGVYVLLRVLRWPDAPVMRAAAVFGAVAFQFSDPLLIHFGNLNLIAGLSWMPWVFAAYVPAMERRSFAWGAVAGLLFAMGFYAGHAQSTMYVGLALVTFTALRVLTDRIGETVPRESSLRRSSWLRSAVAHLSPLAIVALVVFLLASPVLLPSLELTRFTERSDLSYQETVTFSLAPAQAIGLLTPGFFGRGPALHWGLWDRVELPYAGVSTLLMAVAALLLASARTRRRLWPWVGLGLFGMATALGVYAILHGWLTALLPVFDQFRAPARALVLWTFALAVCGAVGVDMVARQGLLAADKTARPDALREGLRTGGLLLTGIALPLMFLALLLTQENETVFLRVSVATLAVTLSVIFWLATWGLVAGRTAAWWSPRTFGVLMVGLLFFDMAATGAYTDVSENDPTSGFEHDEIVAFLESEPGVFRIDTMTGIEGIWQPDTASLYGLQDLGGIANPLSLRHWHELLETTGGRSGRLYDMLNVAFVVVEDGTPLPQGEFELAFDAPGPLSVYRNPDALPRAWLVHEAATAPDLTASLEMIEAAEFDPANTAVIAGETLPPLSPAEGPEPVTVTEYGSDRIALDVEAGGDGLLVLSEVWYPGWRAEVNGVETPVLAINGGLRGVAIPAGASTVEMVFAPATWRIGLLLAGIGLLLLVAWLLVALASRQRGAK